MTVEFAWVTTDFGLLFFKCAADGSKMLTQSVVRVGGTPGQISSRSPAAAGRSRLRLIFVKNLHDFFDRVPIARGSGHTQLFLNFAEVADRFHLPPIDTENESVFNRDDLEQPVAVRWQADRKRRRRAKAPG